MLKNSRLRGNTVHSPASMVGSCASCVMPRGPHAQIRAAAPATCGVAIEVPLLLP